MPRPWIERVEDHPALCPNTHYLVQVADVRKHRKPPGIALSLEHLELEQAGRTHDVVLPLPIRPGGLTCNFFTACGLRVAVNQDIQPRQTLGTRLLARFEQDAATGKFRIVDFRPATEREQNHGQ